jgi:predicted O-methyltransferase YrrM
MFDAIPGLNLRLVDPYGDYPGIRKPYGAHRYEKAKARMLRATKDHNATLLQMKSEDAATLIPDGSLDFVYIDGDHQYDRVMLDMIVWSLKVRSGGIVSGHDYYADLKHRVTVRPAVDDYVRHHGLDLKLTDKDGDKPDRNPQISWWWVKP